MVKVTPGQPTAAQPPSARIAARIESVSGQDLRTLREGWTLCSLPPDAARTPAELAGLAPAWRPAIVPGTVAMCCDEQGQRDLDACDHWYRCELVLCADEQAAVLAGARALLCFDGLATLAEVWLDDELLCTSENMYVAQSCDVSEQLRQSVKRVRLLSIRFAALLPVLRRKKGRGRWPTRLVSEKHLRFVRTTLLGYLPGCCPPVRPVGPYGAVRLVVQRVLGVERLRASARLVMETSPIGVLEVDLSCRLVRPPSELHGSSFAPEATLVLDEGRLRAPLTCELQGAMLRLHGGAVWPGVEPWWPHTHGRPALHLARIEVQVGAERMSILLGRVGFRTLQLEGPTHETRDPHAFTTASFGLRLNGVNVFCRGASFTPLDVRALHGSASAYRSALVQAREAGMNMLRVSGITAYESETFYGLCDELGILVWQDFMFANFDYPFEDPAFAESCGLEVDQVLERLAARPSLAMLCGGSEVAQQAAMMGNPPEVFRQPFFEHTLQVLCAGARPDVPYVPNSPYGAPLPFHLHGGPSHYYGVGAYLRPLDDARSSRVPFASECLAFANPPEPATLRAWLGASDVARDARYLARIVRDPRAESTFADVTDHYAAELFGLSREALEACARHQPEHYLAMGRAAVAEMMERTQAIFRARPFSCHGALVWFLRDLWDSAGWGVIDARGEPKAPYYALKRSWSPCALGFVDQGLDGLVLYATNDSGEALSARVELRLYRRDGQLVARSETGLEIVGHAQHALQVDALLGHFADSSYAYRFGPCEHRFVAARILDVHQNVLAQSIIAPLGYAELYAAYATAAASRTADAGLSATATPDGHGGYAVTVTAERCVVFVAVESELATSDSYFHLVPGFAHRFTLRPRAAVPPAAPGVQPCGTLRPLFAFASTPINFVPPFVLREAL